MKKTKFKRFRSGLKFIALFIFLTVSVVLVALTPVFGIKNIEVNGVMRYDHDTIIHIAAVEKGTNGFRAIGENLRGIVGLRLKNAERSILNNCHYVKDAVVRYVPPSTVRIDIVERDPRFILPYLGTSLMVDAEGIAIDTVDGQKPVTLPLVKGIRLENYELGKKLLTSNPEGIEAAIGVLDAVKESDRNSELKIFSFIDSVDVSDPLNICLFIDSRIVVNLGDQSKLRYRVEAMKHIFFKNLKNTDKGLLDFTVSENPILKSEG